MTDRVDIPPETAGPGGVRPAEESVPKFGLPAAMALIVGSIIGVGIFNLPTSLAAYGPITLVSMALTTVGALALALLFAALSRRLPADGGPYAYARVAFGNPLGFANAWSYRITAWAGNAAIAVGWVLYVEHFINTGHNRFFSVLLVLVGLWIPAAINLSGVKNMGSVQMSTTIIKFVVAGVHRDRRPVLHQERQLHALERQRREHDQRDRRRHGHRPVQLPRGGDRRRRRQGPRPRPQPAAGHHPGDDRHRDRVHALAHGRVRHPADLHAGQRHRAVLRRRQRDVRRHLGRQHHGDRGHHLRLRGAQRLDDDLRGDAAGRGEGRPVPAGVQAQLAQRRAGVRHRGVHLPRLGRDDRQLPRLRRRHRLHDAGPDDRHHRGHPVRVLGAGAAEVAPGRPADDAHAAVRPGRHRRRAVAGLLHPVHLVLAQHRQQLLGLLGSVPAGRRSLAARHSRLPCPAQPPDAGTGGAGVPLARTASASTEGRQR